MKKHNDLTRKLLAVTLAAAMAAGAGLAAPVILPGTGAGIVANAESNEVLTYNGLSFYENDDGSLTIYDYQSDDSTELVIPSKINGKTVRCIADSTFDYNTNLEKIVLPDTITYIGENAFNQCKKLKSVNIPSQLKTLGDYAFCGSPIESVTIPATLERIGDNVFNGTAIKELTLSEGLKTIGKSMFLGIKIKSVVIPDSVTEIGDDAFEWCQELESVTIGSGLTELDDFNFCKKIKSITFRGNNLVKLGGFDCCESLERLNIPDGVKSVSGFTEAKVLTQVSVPDSVVHISCETFRGSPLLENAGTELYLGKVLFRYNGTGKSYSVKNSTVSIAEYAFYECENLESVSIPASVTNIDMYAFNYCNSLSSVTGGDGLLRVGSYAFDDTKWLKSRLEKGEDVYLGNVFVKSSRTKSRVLIKAGTVSIGDHAFSYDDDLTYVRIPSSVNIIGEGAFYAASHLTEVTLPNKVQEICDEAFKYSGLTSITLPANLKKLGEGAFSDCKLKDISLTGKIGTISSYAFSDNYDLVSVVIPAGIKVIDNGAFENCINLREVTFPNTLERINYYAFSCGMTGGEETRLPKVTIPASVKVIEKEAIGFWPYGKTNTVIYGAKGSEAERYALESGFPFNDEYIIENDYMLDSYYRSFRAPARLNFQMGNDTSYYYRRKGAKNWNYLGKGNGVILSLKNVGCYEVKKVSPFWNDPDQIEEQIRNVAVVSPTAFENTSTLSADAVNAGTKVTINGSAVGGTEKYTYTYMYKRSTAKNWSTLAENTTATEASITPRTPGVFDVMVTVKSEGIEDVLVKEMKLAVYSGESFQNTSTISAANVTAGTRVYLNGSAKGGTTVYEYAYYYKRATSAKWNVIGGNNGNDFSSVTSTSFRPSSAGTFDVRIVAKDGDGKEITKDFTVTAK